MPRTLALLFGLVLVSASANAQAIGICSANPVKHSELSSGSRISTSQYDTLIGTTRELCQLDLSDFPAAGDIAVTGTLLVPVGTSRPATCSVGQVFFDSDETAGRNFYGCTASNTWTLLGDGGAGGGSALSIKEDNTEEESDTLTIDFGSGFSVVCASQECDITFSLTESELETALSDVSDVFTNNDGALSDDDVTLSDVQTATSSDFHNIGGTDDDVPESGDLGIIDTEAEFEAELFAITTAAELTTHTSNASAHHTATVDTDDQDASEVSTDTTNFDSNLSAADDTVQKALETLDEISGGSGTDDQVASEVPFTATGGISATDVQAALAEVDSEHTTDTDTQLTEEQVEDFAGSLLGGAETRITVTYNDAGDAIDFVVDDMNDDVPEAGDFGNATDLDTNGALNTDSVSANELDATGVESELEAVLDLQELQGAVTDAQVPDDITVDEATNAGTLDSLDSTAFAILAGQSGGQTIIGGTGAGDDITLQTTSSASKGSYIFSELINCDTIDTDGSGVLSCGTDASGSGGTANTLDLGDDASNESADLIEIATTGDTNSVFTEPTADKLLINLGSNWPTSDASDSVNSGGFGNATDLDANGAVLANAVALGTDTTGNYAAGDAENGAATSGDSATAFFSSGTIEDARIDGSAESDEIDHDATTNFVADEHIDWTSASAGTIDPTNYTDNIGTDDQTATEVPFTATGNISATNVQAAIAEVDSETASLPSTVGDALIECESAGGTCAAVENWSDIQTTLGSLSGDATLASGGAVTVADDSHSHTTTTVSGLDVSDDTNLAVSAPVTLTGDTVGFDASANLTITGDYDAGGGTFQVPNSTTLPGTCEVGDSYMDTDATSGSRWYLCESANTWAVQGGGGGGSLTVEESDGSPSLSSTTTLEFNQADGFSLTDEGSGVTRVDFTAPSVNTVSNEYEPDAAPSTCAHCDEFEDTESLTWRWGNQGTSTAVVDKDNLLFTVEDSSGDNIRARWTTVNDSGDFFAVVKIQDWGGTGAFDGVGLVALTAGTEATPTGLDTCFLTAQSGSAYNVQHLRWNSYTSFSSSAATLDTAGANDFVQSGYVGMEFDDTADELTCWWSSNGYIWKSLGTTTSVSDVDSVGIGANMNNGSSGDRKVLVDFFRNFTTLTGDDWEVGTDMVVGTTVQVADIDGTPDISGVTRLEFSNGSVTDDGSGQVTVDVHGETCETAVYENLASVADDGSVLTMKNYAITITSVGVHCDGTCSGTLADIDLIDRGGTAMTHGAPTVSTTTGTTAFTSVTAANDLIAGEALEFNVGNTITDDAADRYTISYCYTR